MIETKVEGSPSAVDSVATFLSGAVKSAVAAAGDSAIAARSEQRSSWEGDAADAYYAVATDVARSSDEIEEAAGAAAGKFSDYAGRLENIQTRMRNRRDDARTGGLVVDGTVIQAPDAAVPPNALASDATSAQTQQWETTNQAFEAQVAKVELYNELAQDVADDWDRFEQWIDTELQGFAESLNSSWLAEVLLNSIQKNPAAAVAFSLALHENAYKRYASDATAQASRLRTEATEARAQRRSGNPARRAQGNAVDIRGNRQAANALDEVASHASRFGKSIPFIGTAIGAATAGFAIANGDSPGRAIGSEVAGALGGVAGAALVVGGAALLGVGAPVVAVAAGAAIVGVGVAVGFEYAWDNWVPDGAKEAIDEGLRSFGNGVKDVASGIGDALAFWK